VAGPSFAAGAAFFIHGFSVFFRGMAALATGRRAAEELLTIEAQGVSCSVLY